MTKTQLIEALVKEAIETATGYGYLDSPKEGYIRAVLCDPNDYEPDDWRSCLIKSIGNKRLDRKQTIDNAAKWAAKNLGLKSDSEEGKKLITEGLEKALEKAEREGELKSNDEGRIVGIKKG